ncbi:retinol dehydrogenase 14 isoform X1 [Dermacentor silvarum]|uniref:retinol dehydrogenase 14 isoform X1 n=2 Tax=Dermacentor silvarum TaxID=543639 RepID=UPI00189BDB88|nr:retinol dehydrogenase 14 isoform X1 [Dermacentor silvarum]
MSTSPQQWITGRPPFLAVNRLLFVESRVQHTIILLLVVILCVFATVVIFKALSRKKRKAVDCLDHSHDDVDMRGKTVVVTGGNAGIGFETALELSRLGARVIVACRCPSKGHAACEAIRRLTGNDLVEFALLDVASLASVRRFANRLLASEERLDVLVNNAAITAPPQKRLTHEGIEITLATNYLGPFLLTNLLLDLLTRSGPSRVVNVTSALYRFGRVPWEQLETSGGDGVSVEYPGVESTYASSKLLLNLFSVHLARQLQGTEVTCNAVHPGVVATTINQKEPGLRHFLWNSFLHTFGTSPRKGARGSVYLSSSPGLRDVTGKYFVSCRQSSWSSKVLDDETAHKVCRRSAELVRAVLADAHSARAPSSAGTAAQETASFAGLLDDHSTRRDSS